VIQDGRSIPRSSNAWILSSLAWALNTPKTELLVLDGENQLLSSIGMASIQDPGSIWTEIFERLWSCIEGLDRVGRKDALEAFEVEHTRLFFGPPFPAVLPYEHAYREGCDAASLCNDIETSYRKAGFDVRGDFHDLPDHICVELEFAATLLDKGLESKIVAFRSEHLQDFLVAFAKKLQAETSSVFMEVIAHAMLGVAKENEWCREVMESEELKR
jgi:TorA maturation chaperone TorD